MLSFSEGVACAVGERHVLFRVELRRYQSGVEIHVEDVIVRPTGEKYTREIYHTVDEAVVEALRDLLFGV